MGELKAFGYLRCLFTGLGPYVPHCRHSLGPECKKGASEGGQGKLRVGRNPVNCEGFSLPSIVFTGFPHINGSLELVLKSDNVPNDRI